MGTKWIFVWQPHEGAIVDNNQFFNQICDCLRHPDAVDVAAGWASWRSILTYMEPITYDHQSEEVVHTSHHQFAISLAEEPNRHYFLQPIEGRILEVNPWMFSSVYNDPHIFTFEGFQYRFPWTQVRVGKVVDNRTGAVDAVFIEVEFLYQVLIELTWNHIEQYLNNWNEAATRRSWAGRFVLIDPGYEEFGLSNWLYTSVHTAVQYYDVMVHLAARRIP